MPGDHRGGQVRARRLRTVVGAAVVFAICLVPHLLRLRSPSLYNDDLSRVADLQAYPLGVLLFRPVNEHMAPMFEVVSWVTWCLAGRRLVNAPMAFAVASYVPFVLSLRLVGWVVRREADAATTALAAVALFGLSGVYAETIDWYSASSFIWALMWTLVAWLGAVRVCRDLEYVMSGAGWPASDRSSPAAAEARLLCVPAAVAGQSLEIWWANDTGRWLETRSVRWRPDPTRSMGDWAVPFDRLPHWTPNASA